MHITEEYITYKLVKMKRKDVILKRFSAHLYKGTNMHLKSTEFECFEPLKDYKTEETMQEIGKSKREISSEKKKIREKKTEKELNISAIQNNSER